MVPEIKSELFIGGDYSGMMFGVPIDSDAIDVEAFSNCFAVQTYTRRRIMMPPVTWEGFALVSMGDEDVKEYLKSEK